MRRLAHWLVTCSDWQTRFIDQHRPSVLVTQCQRRRFHRGNHWADNHGHRDTWVHQKLGAL